MKSCVACVFLKSFDCIKYIPMECFSNVSSFISIMIV